jgi:hypothetical protein
VINFKLHPLYTLPKSPVPCSLGDWLGSAAGIAQVTAPEKMKKE